MFGEGVIQAIAGSVTRAPWGWVLTATVIITLIKVWPALAQIAADARAKLRGEKREALESCTEQLAAMGERMTAAERQIGTFEVRLMAALSAFHLVDTDLANHAPDSTSRVQARVLLRTAFHVEHADADLDTLLGDIDLAHPVH